MWYVQMYDVCRIALYVCWAGGCSVLSVFSLCVACSMCCVYLELWVLLSGRAPEISWIFM